MDSMRISAIKDYAELISIKSSVYALDNAVLQTNAMLANIMTAQSLNNDKKAILLKQLLINKAIILDYVSKLSYEHHEERHSNYDYIEERYKEDTIVQEYKHLDGEHYSELDDYSSREKLTPIIDNSLKNANEALQLIEYYESILNSPSSEFQPGVT